MGTVGLPSSPLAALLGGSLGAFGFVLFLVTFLLVLGWVTRNRAVLWLGIVLAVVPGLAAAVWSLLEVPRARVGVQREAFIAGLRLIGFCWVALIATTVYRLRKLPAPPRPARREESADIYNRDWMLSLLQVKSEPAREGVAMPTRTEEAEPSHGGNALGL